MTEFLQGRVLCKTALSVPFRPYYLPFFRRPLSSQRLTDFSRIAGEWRRRMQTEPFLLPSEVLFTRHSLCLGCWMELFLSQPLAPQQLLPEFLPLRILLLGSSSQHRVLCFASALITSEISYSKHLSSGAEG